MEELKQGEQQELQQNKNSKTVTINEKYFLIYFLKLHTKEFKVRLSPLFNCFIYFNEGPLK